MYWESLKVLFLKMSDFFGEQIEYTYDSSITATVVSDRAVEYNGTTMSLTALTKLLTGKKYAIAGPRFFKYKGEWLNDIRERLGV